MIVTISFRVDKDLVKAVIASRKRYTPHIQSRLDMCLRYVMISLRKGQVRRVCVIFTALFARNIAKSRGVKTLDPQEPRISRMRRKDCDGSTRIICDNP